MGNSIMTEPDKTLARLATAGLKEDFGEPFLSAFRAVHPQVSEEELKTAAYTCTLFLSAILEGFPTDKLNIFVRHTRDNCSRFTFDCKRYDMIFGSMPPSSLTQVTLLDKDGNTRTRECSKQDIYEAFDFYTNR